ncbi:hypothetical protein LZ32DRAFT_277246 [Colletotrichum eremochloae]|nr:hypothetical protein LZ32DRAFT_277246 [Colletotrichum eremochloae]
MGRGIWQQYPLGLARVVDGAGSRGDAASHLGGKPGTKHHEVNSRRGRASSVERGRWHGQIGWGVSRIFQLPRFPFLPFHCVALRCCYCMYTWTGSWPGCAGPRPGMDRPSLAGSRGGGLTGVGRSGRRGDLASGPQHEPIFASVASPTTQSRRFLGHPPAPTPALIRCTSRLFDFYPLHFLFLFRRRQEKNSCFFFPCFCTCSTLTWHHGSCQSSLGLEILNGCVYVVPSFWDPLCKITPEYECRNIHPA